MSGRDRVAVMIVWVLISTGSAADAEQSVLRRSVVLSIEAQPLGEAVLELSRQSGTQIVVASERVEGHTARAVHGTMTVGDALRQLLDGTGLEASGMGADTVGIAPATVRAGSE